MRLILIGYWAGRAGDGWPDPADFVDLSMDEFEREDVAAHLEHGVIARAFMGLSRCRLCGELNGALELSDGTYIWPEGLAHYVRDHSVRLPHEFVEHVASVGEGFDDAEVDSTWWRGLASPDDVDADPEPN